MRRLELAHLLRAAADIAEDPDILVIGSQAILGSFWEDALPEVAWMSTEADLAFLNDEHGRKADLVDGAIGEMSLFHRVNAYYAQGVEISTALLPDGWRERVVSFEARSAEPAQAVCLERHDVVISKLAAMREKDRMFAIALIDAGLVDVAILLERVDHLTAADPLGASQREAVAGVRGEDARCDLMRGPMTSGCAAIGQGRRAGAGHRS